jgi:hypothetical protein
MNVIAGSFHLSLPIRLAPRASVACVFLSVIAGSAQDLILLVEK